jgi:hypothetical protein
LTVGGGAASKSFNGLGLPVFNRANTMLPITANARMTGMMRSGDGPFFFILFGAGWASMAGGGAAGKPAGGGPNALGEAAAAGGGEASESS